MKHWHAPLALIWLPFFGFFGCSKAGGANALGAGAGGTSTTTETPGAVGGTKTTGASATPRPAEAQGILDALRPRSATIDYYVDANAGSDSADGTSPATAWQSLSKIHSVVLGPGNVVHLARGSVWKHQHLLLDNQSAGSPDAPVVFEAYGTGELPTITEPRALWDATKPFTAVYVTTGSSFITVLDIRVTETEDNPGFAMTAGTHDIVFAGNEVVHAGVGMSIDGSHQKVISNYIHDIGATGVGAGTCLGIVGSALEIGFNHLAHCSIQTSSGLDGGAIEYYGRRVDENGLETYDLSDHIEIHHNVIEDTYMLMEAYGNVTNMVIAYNLYMNANTEALEFHFDDSEHSTWTHECTYDVRIENNTFAPRQEPNAGGWGIVGQLVDFNHLPDPSKSLLTLRNNIFFTNYKVTSHNALGSSFVHDHNLFGLVGDASLGDNWAANTTEKTTDPRFIDAAAGNYQLTSDSPAIAMGKNLGYLTDLSGASVPMDTPPDVGAYQTQ